MNTPATELFDFVLQKAACEPLPVQVRIYRALAHVVGSEHQAATLNQLADELAAALKTQQLLSFATDLDTSADGKDGAL